MDVGKIVNGGSALASLIPGVGMFAGPALSIAGSLLSGQSEADKQREAESKAQMQAQQTAESDAMAQTDMIVEERKKKLMESLASINMNVTGDM